MAIPTDTQPAQTRISQIQAAKEPAGGNREKNLQTNGDEVHDTEPLSQLRVAIWLRLLHCLPPPQRLCHHGANNVVSLQQQIRCSKSVQKLLLLLLLLLVILRSHLNPLNPPQQILLLLPPNLSRCRQLLSTTNQTNKETLG
jgi:hypothetical protein